MLGGRRPRQRRTRLGALGAEGWGWGSKRDSPPAARSVSRQSGVRPRLGRVPQTPLPDVPVPCQARRAAAPERIVRGRRRRPGARGMLGQRRRHQLVWVHSKHCAARVDASSRRRKLGIVGHTGASQIAVRLRLQLDSPCLAGSPIRSLARVLSAKPMHCDMLSAVCCPPRRCLGMTPRQSVWCSVGQQVLVRSA